MDIIDIKPNVVNRKGNKSKLQQTVIDGCIVIFLSSSMLRVDILVMQPADICQNLDNGEGGLAVSAADFGNFASSCISFQWKGTLKQLAVFSSSSQPFLSVNTVLFSQWIPV